MAKLWTDKYVRINKYTRPGTKLGAVKKIVVHWTANPGAGALNHFKYFDGTAIASKRYASAHIFVDRGEAYCIIPLNEVAYHANDGSYRGVSALKPNANLASIGVEMCVEKDGSIHSETVSRTTKIVAELCKLYKLEADDIVRHYDVTRKSCPTPWVRSSAGFTSFKSTVKSMLSGKSEKAGAPKPTDNDKYRLATGTFPSVKAMSEGKAKLYAKYPITIYERASDNRLITGTFTGRNVAEYYAKEIKKDFGWHIIVQEAV
ncbi:peptidoglycan recognition protein family protein [Bacillus sp. JJ722]|uniref:peptidoglycan recognition protein family protein n=1 Tax=Bacillus sp. JJ722 TaxID=3122973 RepID=UPI003F68A10B